MRIVVGAGKTKLNAVFFFWGVKSKSGIIVCILKKGIKKKKRTK